MSIAQKSVTSLMSTFDDDGQLTETFNQSVKQYYTVFRTNVCEHFEQWIKKAVRMDLEQLENYPHHASKSAKNYLLRFVTSNILGAVVKKSSPPNRVMYNDHTGIDRLHEGFLGKNHVNCLILTYRQAFSRACGSNTVETIKSGTKSNMGFFVAMGLFLSSRIEKVYDETGSKYHRPFQVIPQLKMKIRPVTFGV